MADNAYRFSQTRFGYPNSDAPAFQREWKPVDSSGVKFSTVNTDAQTVVKATSSVGVSGTLYVWGMSLATTSTNPQAIAVKDDAGNQLATMVASANGPYFLQLSTPMKVIPNSKLYGERVSTAGASADTYLTVYYASMKENYEA